MRVGPKRKNNQNYYGYKNHAKVDAKSKLITDYLELLDDSDKGQPL